MQNDEKSSIIHVERIIKKRVENSENFHIENSTSNHFQAISYVHLPLVDFQPSHFTLLHSILHISLLTRVVAEKVGFIALSKFPGAARFPHLWHAYGHCSAAPDSYHIVIIRKVAKQIVKCAFN